MAAPPFRNDLPTGNYRSGEAARLAHMPVSRLRLWERRYEVVGPTKSTSGHRRYSDGDVRRLMLINTLVERGHAIGAVARLERQALESLISGSGQATIPRPANPSAAAKFQMTVVGENLTRRLVDTGIDLAAYGIKNVIAYSDMTAARDGVPQKSEQINILLLYLPSLHEDDAAMVLSLADSYDAKAVAVVYGFGAGRAAETLRLASVRLYREPDSRSELRQMVADLCRSVEQSEDFEKAQSWSRAKRRFDDEELEAIAVRSSTIACECPRHLVELIAQLSTFETYSNECTSRSPRDDALHRFLGDSANRARASIEAALARLVQEEGLLRPAR